MAPLSPQVSWRAAQYSRCNTRFSYVGVGRRRAVRLRHTPRFVRRKRLLNAGNQSGLDVRQQAVGPLISVLMPLQNGMKYAGEAIDSIMGQTLMDWQLVVIDNASTDGTDAY